MARNEPGKPKDRSGLGRPARPLTVIIADAEIEEAKIKAIREKTGVSTVAEDCSGIAGRYLRVEAVTNAGRHAGLRSFCFRAIVYISGQSRPDGRTAMPCPVGVHEALEVWQQGEITYRRTLKLVRVDTIADLYVARSSGVEIQIEPAAQEVHLSDGAIRLIDQRLDLAVTVAADAPRMGT